jgi:hypothetical protein
MQDIIPCQMRCAQHIRERRTCALVSIPRWPHVTKADEHASLPLHDVTLGIWGIWVDETDTRARVAHMRVVDTHANDVILQVF